jgi:poly(A) polymerase/tRNA nucleotidyltransferase (CCA-adding enzyme)
MEEKLDNNQWVQELLAQLQQNDKPSDWIEQQRLNGNLALYFPELASCYGVSQNKYHLYDIYYHLLYTTDHTEKRLDLRLAGLFHDIGKLRTKKENGPATVFYNHEIISTEIAFRILKNWKLKRPLIQKVCLLVRNHMFHYLEQWKDSAVRRLLKKIGPDNLQDLFMLRVADREGNGTRKGEPLILNDFRTRIQAIIAEENRFKIKDLEIGGDELIALGQTPGPKMGILLQHLFELVMDKTLPNEKDALQTAALNYIQKNR